MKVTDFLAIYAALLSSAVFLWNIRQARPSYKVRVFSALDTIDGVLTGGISVVIYNFSQKPVHILGILLLYEDRNPDFREYISHFRKYKSVKSLGWVRIYPSHFDIDDKCPATVEPHNSLSIFIPRADVEKLLKGSKSKRFRAIAQDALWGEKRSALFQYQPLRVESNIEATEPSAVIDHVP